MRARKVRNHATVNEVSGDKAMISTHQAQIRELQDRLSIMEQPKVDEEQERMVNTLDSRNVFFQTFQSPVLMFLLYLAC